MAPRLAATPVMSFASAPLPPLSETGLNAALMFALVAERLTVFYEHGQWLTESQGATLAADWLARQNQPATRGQTAGGSQPPLRTLPRQWLKQLSAESDAMAREMAGSLSREAGLYTAHEMTEALDPNHPSDLGQTLMAECARRLAALVPPAP